MHIHPGQDTFKGHPCLSRFTCLGLRFSLMKLRCEIILIFTSNSDIIGFICEIIKGKKVDFDRHKVVAS